MRVLKWFHRCFHIVFMVLSELPIDWFCHSCASFFFVSFACRTILDYLNRHTHTNTGTKWYRTQVSMSCQLPTNSVWIVCLFWYDYEITSWQICFSHCKQKRQQGKKFSLHKINGEKKCGRKHVVLKIWALNRIPFSKLYLKQHKTNSFLFYFFF